MKDKIKTEFAPPNWLYTVLSLTWGLPLTLIGAAVFLVLILAGKKPKRFGYCRYIEVGRNWGGLEGGLFFITCEAPSESLLRHEMGHGLQNIIFGPLMLLLVTVPSAVRWHWRRYAARKGRSLCPYSAVWFERMADTLGAQCYTDSPYDSGIHAKND